MEIGIINLTTREALRILSSIKTTKGQRGNLPKINSYLKLENDLTLRHPHKKFRGNSKKVYNLRGPVNEMRKIMNLVNTKGSEKTVSMIIKKK
jgi:hypothetical protein